MAATHRVFAKDITFAANKCLASIFNGVGSGAVLRVYRVFIYNNQHIAVTGVLTNIELRKLSASSGGTTIVPVKHDTASAALAAEIVTGTNQTITPTDVFRRIIWSTDEPSGNAAMTIDEFQTLHPLCCVWSQGYADTTMDPIVLREGEGFGVINTGASVGQCDIVIEFTTAAS